MIGPSVLRFEHAVRIEREARAMIDPGSFAVGAARLSMPEYAPDATTARRTLAAALDAGVSVVDTANCYGPGGTVGVNERLVADVVAAHRRSEVTVATKAGRRRAKDGSWPDDGRPASLRASVEGSLAALGVETIDLLYLHNPDPDVPVQESFGTLVELVAEGKARAVGLSNCTRAQVAAASAAGPVAAVQNRINARAVVDGNAADAGDRFVRGDHLLFGWAPLEGVRPGETVADAAFAAVADELGVTVVQVALAWLRSLGVTPIVGPRSPAEVAECVAGRGLVLDPDVCARLPRP